MIRFYRAAALLVAVFLTICPATADTIHGKVVGVADGDTLTVLSNGNEQIKVRLSEIDAPEKAQAYGVRSKQSLSDLCFGKNVEVTLQAIDRYGRSIGRVYCAGIDANVEQLKRGMAWVYDKYVKDRALYVVQDEARSRRIGLWSDEDPTPPWLWRKKSRQHPSSY